jgi:hypothetical protein
MRAITICNCILGAICASWLVAIAIAQKVHSYIFAAHVTNIKSSTLRAKTRLLRESFDCVFQTDASSSLLVQTKSLVVDSFFKGPMLGMPFIMHGKSASESVCLLTHVRALAVNSSSVHMKPNLQTQLQRCDGSVIDVDLVVEWIPPVEGSGRTGYFLFGLRLCHSTGDVDTIASPEKETFPDVVDPKLHDERAGTDVHEGANESSAFANLNAKRRSCSKYKSKASRKRNACNGAMPTIVETEEEHAVEY